MTKMIAFHQDAYAAIRRGVGKLTKAVRSTLGPCGHTVLLAKSFGPPTVTRDRSRDVGAFSPSRDAHAPDMHTAPDTSSAHRR